MGMARPQECRKKSDGRCAFCGETEYALLDAHRILPGEEGGKYIRQNLLTLCANCHRKVHAGLIVILGRRQSTAGPVLHYREEGREYWIFEHGI